MRIPSELLVVVRRLGGDLCNRVVFVGGMIRGLLVTDPAAEAARATKDVDLIIDVESRADYYAFQELLRARGFRESAELDAPICRWVVDGIPTDVMPVDPEILGFTNLWYADAFEYAISEGGGQFRILDAARFCATKIESFAGRGGRNYYHHDLEDWIAIVDGRPSLYDEIVQAPKDVRIFLAEKTAALLLDEAFLAALSAHLLPDDASQGRLPNLLSALRRIADLAKTAEIHLELPTVGSVSYPLVISRPDAAGVYSFALSSNLRSGQYDSNSKILRITFRSGATYEYLNVPETTWAGLLQAYSAGGYFHRWIRKRYRHRRAR